MMGLIYLLLNQLKEKHLYQLVQWLHCPLDQVALQIFYHTIMKIRNNEYTFGTYMKKSEETEEAVEVSASGKKKSSKSRLQWTADTVVATVPSVRKQSKKSSSSFPKETKKRRKSKSKSSSAKHPKTASQPLAKPVSKKRQIQVLQNPKRRKVKARNHHGMLSENNTVENI